MLIAAAPLSGKVTSSVRSIASAGSDAVVEFLIHELTVALLEEPKLSSLAKPHLRLRSCYDLCWSEGRVHNRPPQAESQALVLSRVARILL